MYLPCPFPAFVISCAQTTCSFLQPNAFIGKRSKCDPAYSPVNLLLMKLVR